MSHHLPVLYINSIGMRMPRLKKGAMFAQRVTRKLKSMARGLVQVEPGFSVMSPLATALLQSCSPDKTNAAMQNAITV